MKELQKLSRGDKVAILSPSFAAPGRWPYVHELGLQRLREIFGLQPVEYPSTRDLYAGVEQKAEDLETAFADPEIKAVIATIGGDIQVTYVANLKRGVFVDNPKPFFGYSDNSHMANFLFLLGIPSFYGASVLTQFAMQGNMDAFTVDYTKHALFDKGEFQLLSAPTYNDIGLHWDDPALLQSTRALEPNDGWYWDGDVSTTGLLWGGCVEAVDEMMRHAAAIPSLEQFADVVLMLETSEEIPPASYVLRVIRALGERGILARVRGVLMGRPKAWEFDKPQTAAKKAAYRAAQREVVVATVRRYNGQIPIVQNLDFGHTDPQIPMPYGGRARIDADKREIWASF